MLPRRDADDFRRDMEAKQRAAAPTPGDAERKQLIDPRARSESARSPKATGSINAALKGGRS